MTQNSEVHKNSNVLKSMQECKMHLQFLQFLMMARKWNPGKEVKGKTELLPEGKQ